MYIYNDELYNNGIHKPLLRLTEYDRLQKIITKGRQAKHDPLWFKKKLFTCRVCGTAISGYKRTKKYKNGETGLWYYTKHSSKVSCSEKSMTAKELNNEFKAKVGSMKFTPRFIEKFERLAKSEYPGIKRRLAKIVGSNLTIQDRHLMIDSKKSFIALQKIQYRLESELSLIEPQDQADNTNTTTQTPPLKGDATLQYRVRESNP